MVYIFMTIAALHVTGMFAGTATHFWDFVHDEHFFEDPSPVGEGVP